jgi:hypothetical protein
LTIPDELTTFSVTIVVCGPLVAMPLTVSGYEPAATDGLANSVNVAEPPAVTVAGLNDAVTPLGAPVTDNAMDCAEPAAIAVLMVVLVEAPAVMLTEGGEAAREKSFAPVLVIVTDTVVECVPLPAVPVTVTG